MSTSDVDGVCDNLESCKLDAEKKISDEELFKQPPSLFGDCPICFERIPTLHTGSKYKTCCGKVICSGCVHAPVYDNQGNKVAEKKCPFCRTPKHKSVEEANERREKRVEADDPIAIYNLGSYNALGLKGFPQDYTKALELWHRAGEHGLTDAYYCIGIAYERGDGVDVDKKKAIQYYQLAAIGGSESGRHMLGLYEAQSRPNYEGEAGNVERALKHFMIAVRGGHNESLKQVKMLYSNGRATKEDYTKALRLYQEYLSEIKTVQRDEAAAYSDRCRYY